MYWEPYQTSKINSCAKKLKFKSLESLKADHSNLGIWQGRKPDQGMNVMYEIALQAKYKFLRIDEVCRIVDRGNL